MLFQYNNNVEGVISSKDKQAFSNRFREKAILKLLSELIRNSMGNKNRGRSVRLLS